MIKPIETKYKGYRFRGRLEARWAVFFDALEIRYEYEPEGFNINGVYYLPDFWLPDHHWFVEVKRAGAILKGEWEKINAFDENSMDLPHPYQSFGVIVVYGPPDDPFVDLGGGRLVIGIPNVPYYPYRGPNTPTFYAPGWPDEPSYIDPEACSKNWHFAKRIFSPESFTEQQIRSAVKAALSARFEYGESPSHG